MNRFNDDMFQLYLTKFVFTSSKGPYKALEQTGIEGFAFY